MLEREKPVVTQALVDAINNADNGMGMVAALRDWMMDVSQSDMNSRSGLVNEPSKPEPEAGSK